MRLLPLPSAELAYFTWHFALSLGVAFLAGLAIFWSYKNRKYDGDEIVPGYEWRRGTGHGVYAGKVTRAQLYSSQNKWKPYRKSWERTGVFFCFCGAVFVLMIVVFFPMAFVEVVADGEGCAWAQYGLIKNSGGVSAFVRPSFFRTILSALLALICGLRMGYGVVRLGWLRKREKSGRFADALTRAEQACMGLFRTDAIISLVAFAVCLTPFVWAVAFLAGPEARGASSLPEPFTNGLFTNLLAGVCALYMLWAVAVSVQRRKIARKNP